MHRQHDEKRRRYTASHARRSLCSGNDAPHDHSVQGSYRLAPPVLVRSRILPIEYIPTGWYANYSMTARPTQPDSRTRLLDAAMQVIRARGYSGTTVDDICAAAGLTKGAFFHHFKSK